MLEVSEKANEMIGEFLKTQEEPHSIRIFVTGGCSGPSLGMALDSPLETDELLENRGLTFIVDKVLLEEAKPISVDYITTPEGSGFQLKSSLASDGCECGGGSCCC